MSRAERGNGKGAVNRGDNKVDGIRNSRMGGMHGKGSCARGLDRKILVRLERKKGWEPKS